MQKTREFFSEHTSLLSTVECIVCYAIGISTVTIFTREHREDRQFCIYTILCGKKVKLNISIPDQSAVM